MKKEIIPDRFPVTSVPLGKASLRMGMPPLPVALPPNPNLLMGASAP